MTADAAAIASIDAATRKLHLPGIREHAGRLANQAQRTKATYLGFLADTLSVEIDDRAERRRSRRIHEAHFPRLKRLADFNLDAAPTINPATVATLAPAATSTPATLSCRSAIPAPARPIYSSRSASPRANKDVGSATPPCAQLVKRTRRSRRRTPPRPPRRPLRPSRPALHR
jgi:IstB-like ATP binding protein